jgi:hypothetical protein
MSPCTADPGEPKSNARLVLPCLCPALPETPADRAGRTAAVDRIATDAIRHEVGVELAARALADVARMELVTTAEDRRRRLQRHPPHRRAVARIRLAHRRAHPRSRTRCRSSRVDPATARTSTPTNSHHRSDRTARSSPLSNTPHPRADRTRIARARRRPAAASGHRSMHRNRTSCSDSWWRCPSRPKCSSSFPSGADRSLPNQVGRARLGARSLLPGISFGSIGPPPRSRQPMRSIHVDAGEVPRSGMQPALRDRFVQPSKSAAVL